MKKLLLLLSLIYISINSYADITGNWKGTWSSYNGVNGGSLSATLRQSGSGLSGVFSLTASPCLKSGSISGSVYGNDVLMSVRSGAHLISLSGRKNTSLITGSYMTDAGRCRGGGGTIRLYKKQSIPLNASASGSSWKCNYGYKKSGNNCIKDIYIPPNAYSSGSGWKCNSGYLKIDNGCIKDDKVYSAASGSGFAVTSDGYVITNYHVIEGCTDVKIHDKGKSIMTTLVTFDPLNDIALLKGNFKPRSYYPLSRKSPKLLMNVYVAGHPFGQAISTSVKVTKGIVSSLSGVANNFSNLQIDAALQPGNSGGPIMNDKGNVIGVAVAKLDLETIVDDYGVVPENVNFGVKANVVINILESENIKLPSPNINTMPTSELGELITNGTYYLSCWMTIAQIETMLEQKVMFSNLK